MGVLPGFLPHVVSNPEVDFGGASRIKQEGGP